MQPHGRLHEDAPRMGRPPLAAGGSTQLAIRFADAMIAEIDAIIETRHGQGNRPAIVRELVAEALAARAKGRK